MSPTSDKAKAITVKCPETSFVERAVGFLAASVFSVVYVFAPIYVFSSPLALYKLGAFEPTTWIYLSPLILSAIIPSRQNRWALGSWFFRCVPKYFGYSEVLEFSDAELVEYSNKRPCMLVVCPHGVISFGGICSGIAGADFGLNLRQEVLNRFPTAVASVVIQFPIMKHVIGIFGLLDASKRSLTKQIKAGKSFVLYPGGIAELFLSSPTEEMILVRKGFIKLALSTGADVIPLYLFGNTTVLEVIRHPLLMSISRTLGISLTFFWGRWNLPLPKPDPLIYVRGRPLQMPKIEKPTDEDINKWHGVYVAEVQRLFDTYKVLRPDFKDKHLQVMENDKEDKKKK